MMNGPLSSPNLGCPQFNFTLPPLPSALQLPHLQQFFQPPPLPPPLPSSNIPPASMPDMSAFAGMQPLGCSHEVFSHFLQLNVLPPIASPQAPKQENGLDLTMNKSTPLDKSSADQESFWSFLQRLPNANESRLEEGERSAPPALMHSTPIETSASKHGGKRRKCGFQAGITVGYTYDAFFVSDGRSRKRKCGDSCENTMLPSSSSESSECTSRVSTPRPQGHGQTRYTCNECGKDYATSSNLSRHKQTHRSLDSQLAKRCPHCDKVYVSMPALSMHILTHNLKHQCDICGKAFSRPWLLQGHKRAHTGEKPYGCAHCGRAFADRSNLRAHMQTHSSLRTYECPNCKKRFAQKTYLSKHMETCGSQASGSNSSSSIVSASDQSTGSDQKPLLPLSIAALVGES